MKLRVLSLAFSGAGDCHHVWLCCVCWWVGGLVGGARGRERCGLTAEIWSRMMWIRLQSTYHAKYGYVRSVWNLVVLTFSHKRSVESCIAWIQSSIKISSRVGYVARRNTKYEIRMYKQNECWFYSGFSYFLAIFRRSALVGCCLVMLRVPAIRR